MKLNGRQSSNIENRTGDSSATAFKSNPKANPALVRVTKERQQEYADYGKKTIQNTMDNKGPFRDMLTSMDKPLPKSDPNASIPMPTARPDPTQPYTKPTVMVNLTGYSSQVTPGDWKESK